MFRVFVGILLLSAASAQQGYVVSTVAGGGAPPVTVTAAQSQVGQIAGIAADDSGNEYISAENCVFRIDSAGVMTRVAGIGRPGYSGDGGAARDAQLNIPSGLALDATGNLYIADSGNGVIRKLTPDGKIRTVPGSAIPPMQSYVGHHVAVAASGDIFISSRQANTVWRLSHSGSISRFAGNGQSGYSGDGGPATAAAVGGPTGVAVDRSGNVFIAQSAAVRKVTPAGIITTVAGTGISGDTGDGGQATQARLSNILGLTVDSSETLYIAEVARIRKVSAAGVVNTIAGGPVAGYSGDGGPAINAELTHAYGVAVTASGDLYIADNVRLRHVNPSGTIETIEGGGVSYTGDGGPATAAQLYSPSGITLDARGNLYIADNGSRIRKVSPAGIISTFAGGPTFGYSGDGGPAVDALMLLYPLTGMAVDPSGDVFVVENLSNDVREVTAQGTIRTFVQLATSQPSSFFGLAMDGNGNLFVADSSVGLIRKVDTAGHISTFVHTASNSEYRSPYALAIDSANNVYVSYFDAYGVTEFSPSGSPTERAANVVSQEPIAVDAAGNIYASNSPVLVKIAPDGTTTNIGQEGFSYPVEGAPALGISGITPTALTVDSSGDIFIADSGANAVFKLHPAPGPLPPAVIGVYQDAAGDAGPVSPGAVVVVYGAGMGPASPVTAAAGTVVTTLGGTQVFFDEIPAALVLVSATQITAVVPYGISASTKVTVSYGGMVSAPLTVPVGWADPERRPKNLVVPKHEIPSARGSF